MTVLKVFGAVILAALLGFALGVMGASIGILFRGML